MRIDTMRARFGGAFLAALLALAPAAHAARVVATPALPVYGQNVTLELRDMQWPAYLPVTRFSRSGSTFVIDFEYGFDAFRTQRPDFGVASVSLGELVPGNYTIEARLFRVDTPEAPPQVVTQSLAVAPPENWGIYAVPQEPQAFAPIDALVRSAVYFEPGSMQVSVSGSVIRVDFDYHGNAPVGAATPPGTTSFAAVRVPPLPPGSYTLEGWGRDKATGVTERYFTRPLSVSSAAWVVEYYSASNDHYFVTASPTDMAQLDAGVHGDWKRTGQRFKAWLRMGDGPPGAQPVCRFYASGPNSHFYTGDTSECAAIRALEAHQRAQADARGEHFAGWAFENIAFYAVLPQNGQCPGGMTPVFRLYNAGGARNDSNHRFTADATQRLATAMTWIEEGVAFCSPG